jgi:hypothetical protein
VKFDVSGFFKSVEKIQVSLKSDKNNGYFTCRRLYIYIYIFFFIIPHSVLLRMRNVADKSCRENQDTHFKINNFFKKSCCS